MIIGLHHAQITIPKGRESEGRCFYCDILGLKEIEKPETLKGRGGFWLQVGDREVHVGTENGVMREVSKAHLAYHVNDISLWREKLTSAKIEILESVPILGYERFEFRDPFGNRVEFIQSVSEE